MQFSFRSLVSYFVNQALFELFNFHIFTSDKEPSFSALLSLTAVSQTLSFFTTLCTIREGPQ